MKKEMLKKETMRLNINVSIELMSKVDFYADLMGINRTSAVAVLLNFGLSNSGVLLNEYEQ